MLDHMGYTTEANKVRHAIDDVYQNTTIRTKDVKGTASTTEFANEIIARL